MSPIREYEKHTMKNKKTTQLHRGDLDPLIKILESKGVDVRSIVTTLAMVEQSDPKYQADGRALVLEMAIIAAMGNREGRKKPAEPNAPAERQKRRTIADLEAELRTLMQSEIPATRGQIGEAMGCSPGQVDRVLESMRPDLKVEGEGPKATYVLRQTVLDGALASKVTSALQQAAPIRPKPPKKAAKKVSKSEAKKKSKKAVAKKKAPERTPPKAPTKAANEKPPNKTRRSMEALETLLREMQMRLDRPFSRAEIRKELGCSGAQVHILLERLTADPAELEVIGKGRKATYQFKAGAENG